MPSQNPPEGADTGGPGSGKTGGRRPKILITDDSVVVRSYLESVLGACGYDVYCLQNPLEFDITLRRERPDLVLMDVEMPAIRGNRLVESVARDPRTCPIILFSALPEDELQKTVESCGAAGYISKGVTTTELLNKIRNHLRT